MPAMILPQCEARNHMHEYLQYSVICLTMRAMSGFLQKLHRWLTLQMLPSGWRMACFGLIGILIGLAAVTFNVSRATSYMRDDPETCINCHVMNTAYATWRHSSHRNVATCSDCHVPHTNIFAQYAFKAQDGLRHSVIFTMRTEPEVIRITPDAIPVVNGNCIRCHERTVMNINMPRAEHQTCWHCHETVPHGEVRSLSATPQARRPELPAAGWLAGDREEHDEQQGER